MKLTKDGITVNVSHPTDIARYKRAGYVVVIPEANSNPEGALSAPSKKPTKAGPKTVKKEISNGS